ncbi:MAG: ankyrin repeat domain-containing protein [Luteolibacter sp.]
MQWFSKRPAALVWLAISLAGLPSCRKQVETLKSDLGEAGYKLTPEDWFRASRENDPAALKKFISAGFRPDARNPDGDSALHIAASAGAENSAKFLLDRGLPVDVRGGSERTPLMAAVMADQTPMVRWLLRQGADPRAKDKDGFMPLMLAVREGSGGSVAELASYNRENLDAALLLAALVGRADVIDSLTNYGASVYARMEDGRTPLMIAAENGNKDAVKLLLELGASRYTADPDGRTAADLATGAGHAEIASLILREPLPEELELESPEKIAQKMDSFVDTAAAKGLAGNKAVSSKNTPVFNPPTRPLAKRGPSKPINGETLSTPVAIIKSEPGIRTTTTSGAVTNPPFAMPPLIMRHYSERELPINVQSVQGDTATVSIAGSSPKQMKVRTGETIPGSRLAVVSVKRRMENSKVSQGRKMEIAVMDVRDTTTGTTREWTSGISAEAHDPVALVEDSATGKRYVASQGQHFKAADGTEYRISDVRPNQLVIEEVATGAVQTIPLRGPRG